MNAQPESHWKSPYDYTFRFGSGRLALDFVATVGNRRQAPHDRWREAGDLARWCREAGLLEEAPKVSEAKLEAGRRLREAIYRLLQAARQGEEPAPGDIEALNRAAARPPLAPRLGSSGHDFTWHAARPLEAVLAAVARDAVELLAGDRIPRVRECAEVSCTILFLDGSRPGKRRWCAMARCGNRSKKAAFRRRHKNPD